MFSLMQMLWEGAADTIGDLIDRLNAKERYDFDKDFILKVALVCTNHGARYEVDKLRNETNVKEIEQSFPWIAEALVNCKDFIVTKGRFLDDRILRSYNTLIPFVYFFYLQPNQQVKSEETLLRMNHALYLSLMTNLFSRFADNYIDQVVNNILLPHHQKNPGQFPLEDYLAFMLSKQGRSQLDDWLLQNNIHYLMNILEGGTRLPAGKRSRRPEVDHIFPHSKLQALGIPEERSNHYANFRLIPQPENNWKRAQDPQPYFKANPSAAQRYFIPTGLLAYEQYAAFLVKRRELIWDHLRRFFGLEKDDRQANTLPPRVQTDVKAVEPPAALPEPVSSSTPSKPAVPGTFRSYCDSLLDPADRAYPLLADQRAWAQVMPDRYGRRWRSIYINTLKQRGVNTIGDLVSAILALKLDIWWVEDGYAMLYFHHPGPDKKPVTFPKFSQWGWVLVLRYLETQGFEWREHVTNPEKLAEVRSRYSDVPVAVAAPPPVPSPAQVAPATVPTVRQALDAMLTEEQKALLVIQNATPMLDVFKGAGYNAQWRGRFHRILFNLGIRNLGDFAAAVIALKLKITHRYADGTPFYQFVATLPDGRSLFVPTREFGPSGWKAALNALAQNELEWKKYLVG